MADNTEFHFKPIKLQILHSIQRENQKEKEKKPIVKWRSHIMYDSVFLF